MFFLFLIMHGKMLAQYESRKGYAGLSIGTSIPMDVFSSTDNYEESGYAKTGVAFNLNFAYRLATNFGLTAMMFVQVNPFDDEGLHNNLKGAASLGTIPVNIVSVNGGSWGQSGFMVGGFGSIPIGTSGKFIFEPRAMVALITAISPKVEIQIKSGNRIFTEEQQAGAGAAIGLSFGGGFRFNLSDRIALLLNGDYVESNPKFYDVEYWHSDGSISYLSFQQKMQAVNVTLGLAFRFKKDNPPQRKSFKGKTDK